MLGYYITQEQWNSKHTDVEKLKLLEDRGGRQVFVLKNQDLKIIATVSRVVFVFIKRFLFTLSTIKTDSP